MDEYYLTNNDQRLGGSVVRTIYLTKDKFSIVDDEDYEKVSKIKWHYSNGYAVNDTTISGIRVILRMHRLINNTPEYASTDHINRNRLDNRKENLRTCDQSGNRANCENKTNYRGVSKSKNKWRAAIKVNGISINLGNFYSKEIAALAYNAAAQVYQGEFSSLNKVVL